MNELCLLYAIVFNLCLTQITVCSVSVNLNEISDKTSESKVDLNDKKHLTERNIDKLTVLNLVNENNRNIQKFKCKTPRKKVVSLKSLFGNSPDRSYYPSCVVMHVCDDESGCCNSELHKCVPKRRGSFQLYFMVGIGKNHEPQKFTFPNDTECECREKNSRPRSGLLYSTTLRFPDEGTVEDSLCENPKMVCPKPFILRPVTYKAPYKCRCDCATDDHYCHKVKKGIHPLSPEQQRCVAIGDCQRPVCGQNLEYDLWLGLCRSPTRKESIRHSNHYNRLNHFKNRH